MRKVIEATLISIDGVIGEPHAWTGEHFDGEVATQAIEQLASSDAMIMGRNTYEMFSQIWSAPDNDYSAAIYNIRKYVFSSTLEDAEWNNTVIVRDDPAQAVSELKQKDGKDILMYGHGPVGQALIENNLLDELKLLVVPVVVGGGNLLFRPGDRTELTLVRSHITSSGVAILTYVPAAAS